jgi:hypothetical protein
MSYTCSKCGLAVIVFNGEVIKACHCEAPIIANMKATAKGVGGLKAHG